VSVHAVVLSAGLSYRIQHRLPGRLRLVVPALSHVPAARRPEVQHHLAGATLPPGITEVTPGFITGSLLIRYRPEVLTEAEVLEWFGEILEGVRDLAGRLLSLPETQRPAAARRLGEVLSHELRRGRQLGPGLIEVTSVRQA
jgi:hypothetical protein